VTPAGGTGATTTYSYGALNRVTAEAKPAPGPTVTFGYDAVGNLRFHTGPGGVTEYRYTPVNLLAQLLQPGAARPPRTATTRTNNRTSTTHPGEVVVTNAYNAASTGS
jgi:hypothetical protein